MARMSAEELQKQHGWNEPASPELMKMLKEFSDEEIMRGGLIEQDLPLLGHAPETEAWTPDRIREVLYTEIALQQAGKLIEQARERRGLSTRELAQKVGVSQPRVVQVQNAGESLNLGTLVKFAAAMNYRLRLELVPNEGGEPLKTV